MSRSTRILAALLGAAVVGGGVLAALSARSSHAASSQDIGWVLAESPAGPIVVHASEGSIAAAVGLLAGDTVVGIKRQSTSTIAEAQRTLWISESATASIQIARGGVVTEVWLPLSAEEIEALRAEPVGARQCASMCRTQGGTRWQECGCVIASRKVCNGCSSP